MVNQLLFDPYIKLLNGDKEFNVMLVLHILNYNKVAIVFLKLLHVPPLSVYIKISKTRNRLEPACTWQVKLKRKFFNSEK